MRRLPICQYERGSILIEGDRAARELLSSGGAILIVKSAMRRVSAAESTSSSHSDANFDDADDHQVFALLEDGDEASPGDFSAINKGYAQ